MPGFFSLYTYMEIHEDDGLSVIVLKSGHAVELGIRLNSGFYITDIEFNEDKDGGYYEVTTEYTQTVDDSSALLGYKSVRTVRRHKIRASYVMAAY